MNLKIKQGSENYVCSVVEIKEIFDIERADRIKRTVIFGNNVIIGLNVKVGDKMLYFNSGTKLNVDFCKWNNLLTDKELNKDKVVGYISHKQFRVKAIKLKGIISDGILLPISSLTFTLNYFDSDFKIGDSFTDIDGISICEKYFIPIRNSNPGGSQPKVERFKRLVDGQFHLHNDTENLRRNIHKINPEDIISINYKKHGTSFVVGNILVKKKLSKFKNWLIRHKILNQVPYYYDIIYSSRKVIKNSNINPDANHYYGEDIWGVVAQEIGDKIPKGWTLYGEIIGYTQNKGAIQSMNNLVYDYGCQPGEHKVYIYKISIVNSDGHVIYLTDKQIEEYCERVGLLFKDTFIYYGRAIDKFNYKIKGEEWSIEKWRELFLETLEATYNEKDCYMCVNKLPQEGIVLRKESLFEYEAYKLKSKRFLLGESDEQEKEIINIEDEQTE